jgi:uncharacterized repeat protein (TIGR02543 family)
MQKIMKHINPVLFIKNPNVFIGTFLFVLIMVLLSHFQTLNAQQDFNYVDLNNWNEVGGTADWSVLQGGRTLKQVANTSTPTFYVSNTDYINVAIRGTIQVENRAGDDDFIGFVIGFQKNSSVYDFLLVEWGYLTRTFSQDGMMSLTQFSNVSNFNISSAHQSYKRYHSSGTKSILATNPIRWEDKIEYDFEFLYTETTLKLLIDGNVIFNQTTSVDNPFEIGKFGFYGNSQPNVVYGNVRVVNINPNANEPVANPDQYGTSKNTTLTVNADNGLLFNDYDPNLDNFVIQNFTQPSHGTLSLVTSTGAFTYTPNNNYIGPDSFTYNLVETDTNDFLTSETVTVSLNVIDGTNVAPSNIVIDLIETFSTFENGTQLATVTAIDSNAGDFHDYLLIDNNGGRFGINGNRILLADKSNILYGNSYNIVVRAVDFGNLSVDRTLSIKMPYSIIYNLAGGINNISNPAIFTASTAAITLVTPSRFGFTFDGWYDQVSGGSIVTEIPTGTQTNQVIYAQWLPVDFNINYDLRGGNNAISNPGIYNVLDLPLFISPPTKAGFVFDGWQIFLNNDSILTPSGLISIKNSQTSIQASIHNYQLFIQSTSWTDSQQYCMDRGGYLATVTSEIEWNYILNKSLQNSNVNDRFWLGGQAMDKRIGLNAVQQNWQWLNNEGSIPLNSSEGFQNWASGEPNNAGGEYYLVTWNNQSWNDLPNISSNIRGFICEYDQQIELDELITLSAVYLPNSYQIIFNVNGGSTLSNLTLGTESVLNLPTPTKTSFEFGGWYLDSNLTIPFEEILMPPNDITLFAKWNDIIYSVTYQNLENSINPENNPVQFTVSSPEIALLPATKTGYTFMGWFDNGLFLGSGLSVISTGTIGNLNLYAKWQINQYTITFDTMGGSLVDPIVQNFGTNVTAPNEPNKVGHTFAGWSQAIPSTIPSNNLTLTALWTINQYTITFDTVGGSIVDPIVQNFGTNVTAPNEPNKVGHTFAGWSQAIPSTIPSSNLTLTALWTINQYTITFDTVGGAEIGSMTADYDASITLPNPSRAGFRFESWSEFGIRVNHEAMPLGDRTLVAIWTPLPFTIKMINPLSNEETFITDNFGSPIQLPQINQPGYAFGGWLENNLPVRFTTMPIGNRTLIASFNARSYTITFNSEKGIAPAPIQGAYQSIIQLPMMDLEHFTFLGWQGPNGLIQGSFQVPLNGASFTAVFEPKLYTISFIAEGVEIPKLEVPFDTPITLPTPSKAGYRFTGWTINGTPYSQSKMPGENITLTATFEKVELILRLVSEGLTIRESTLYLNDSFTVPTAQKRGHTFDGWYEGNTRIRDGLMPARNLTLEARFLINSYPVSFVDHDSTVTERFVYERPVELPVRERLGYRFIGWARNGQVIDQLIMTDAVIELNAVYQPLIASMTFITPLQKFEASITTNQPLTNLNPLNVPDGYTWVGYFSLPFGVGEAIQAGRMIGNAHDTMMYPYYLRAGQVFESSSNLLSTEPYYFGNFDTPVSHTKGFPWFESITFITTSMALVGLYVASKGGKWDETI